MTRDMKTTLTRIFTIAVLMLISMVAAAIDVQIVNDGVFKEGTVTCTQEKPKDGKVLVTLLVTPNKGFSIQKDDIIIVSTYPPSSDTKSDTRADGPKIAGDLTLDGPKETISYPNSAKYTVTVEESLGVWVQSVTFRESSDFGTKGTINFNQPDGYYYLGNEANDNGVVQYNGNNFSANFYMCPAYSATVNEQNYLGGDSGKPLITTLKTFPAGDKTYLNYAVWYIEAATGEGNAGYFYIKHINGQYIVANDNNSPGTSRRRVNLAPIDPQNPTAKPGNDGMFKIQSDDSGDTYYIYSRTKADGSNKYFSPSKGNKDQLYANGDNDNTGGIIGFWKDKIKNSAWHFVEAQCATPVITYNMTNNKVTMTSTEDATIYYTIDGTTTPDPNNAGGENPTKVYDPNDKPTVSVTTTIKAIAVMPARDNTKPPLLNSELASMTIVLNPTINVTNPVGGIIYDGTAKEPEVSVEYNGTPIPTTEYEVSYSDNTNAGTATVAITGFAGGNYVVNGSTTFEIAQREATLAWSGTELSYNGSAQHTTATVSNLVEGDECTVTVSVPEGDGIAVGSYTATATDLSNSAPFQTRILISCSWNRKERILRNTICRAFLHPSRLKCRLRQSMLLKAWRTPFSSNRRMRWSMTTSTRSTCITRSVPASLRTFSWLVK